MLQCCDNLGPTSTHKDATLHEGASTQLQLANFKVFRIKEIRHKIKRWRLHLRSDMELEELVTFVNPIVRGWINYYGRFYPSRLVRSLRQVDEYLIRWARQKYKRPRTSLRRTLRWLRGVKRHSPILFAYSSWTHTALPAR
ncbi:group II intron maturase-specific domain-containing protein [Ferrimicrobium sp.]|uniref:group II intron maturase-specific domain-containing protein n=1 Tax=Ferrimicrobium sp. TaxID=2926050 RepID=UPI00345C9CAF